MQYCFTDSSNNELLPTLFPRTSKLNESLLLLILGNSRRYQRSQIAALTPKAGIKKSAINENFDRYASSWNKRKEQLCEIVQPKRAPLERRDCACQNLSNVMIS
ncbi:hypothetical protein PUN28_015924 [Cardiocondyla obscurior]|uniref:Uncharacterized protein n=1 Tax=Cardiocondyla obscurior TaxID=286306 RepID=A0AAW2ERT7_9HYME